MFKQAWEWLAAHYTTCWGPLLHVNTVKALRSSAVTSRPCLPTYPRTCCHARELGLLRAIWEVCARWCGQVHRRQGMDTKGCLCWHTAKAILPCAGHFMEAEV